MGGITLQPGEVLNERYRIVRVIGKGGMGTVYQAEHARLGNVVAIKEVHPPAKTPTESKEWLERSEQEAKLLVNLHHPNLPKVTDAFVDGDAFYLVMEFIEGKTLETVLEEGGKKGLPVAQVLGCALQLSDVLAYLHSQIPPIIFRDLKPANIMLEKNGRIRLIDFGIARRFDPSANRDTALLGSVGYSPPEQFGRHQTDTRSDIYSFGATLHSLLTGHDPANSPFKFEPASKLNPNIPENLAQLIERCVRLDAFERPQRIHDVALELLTIKDSLQYFTPPTDSVNAPIVPKGKSGEVRTVSGSAAGMPSVKGATVLTEQPNSNRGLKVATVILSVLLLGLLVGGGFYIYTNRTKPNNTIANTKPNTTTTPTLPSNPNSTLPTDSNNTTPSNPTVPNSNGTSNNNNVPPITHQKEFSFSETAPLGQERGYTGEAPVLRLKVSGQTRGMKGEPLTLAIFFYDTQNNPLPRNPQSDPRFASQNGQLSVAGQVTPKEDVETVSVTLEIPFSAFPDPLPQEGIVVRCAAFHQNTALAETTYLPINPELLLPVQQPSNPQPQPQPNQPRGGIRGLGERK